ncbi:MAG: hypothetical protein ABSA53_13865 [Streptosporangiaceae bacterium]|jgi:hypothetical protein
MHAKAGFPNGWYDGRTVRFYYSKNYFCRTPPASSATLTARGGTQAATDPNSGPLLPALIALAFWPAGARLARSGRAIRPVRSRLPLSSSPG